MMMRASDRKSAAIVRLLLAGAVVGPLVLMFLLGLTPGISFTEDLGRHLLMGRIILETHHVPGVNYLTYTHPDFPFINHHWLFECIVAVLYPLVGLNGLIVLKAAAMTAALGLAMRAALLSAPWDARVAARLWVVAILSAIVLNYRAHIRPELVSFVATGALLWLFEVERGARIAGRTRWVQAIRVGELAILFVWVNAHLYFMFGLGMLGAFALERVVTERSRGVFLREAAWMVGACVVGLCNPNGLDGLLYPFRILLNYGVQITENLSPWALSRNAVNPMLLALPVLMILTVWALVWGFLAFLREVRASRAGGGDPLSGGRLANAIIALGALIASFSMARHTPLLALAGLPVVAHASRLSGAGRRSAWVLPVALVALGLNVFVGWAVIDGSWSRRFRAPTAPTAFGLDISERYEGLRQLAREYSLLGPVFSDFNIGSLVEYNLYPIPGYVDNRPEAFPMSFWNEEYYPAMASPARCRETLQRRGVNLVALSLWNPQLPLSPRPGGEAEWALVHLGDFMAVWVRHTEANATVIREREVTPERLEVYARELSEELLRLRDVPWWRRQAMCESILFRLYGIARAGRPDLARTYMEQIVALYPDYRMAREALREIAQSDRR